MAQIARIRLTEFFQSISPVYVLGTTYTASLAFFEAVVFRHIDRTHLRRCIVLCDPLGFQATLQEASALRSIGRDYMAVCAPCPGAFHAKVWLLIGEDEAALLAGSGNLTQPGFATNLELFDAMRFDRGQAHPRIIDDVVSFLNGLRQLWANEREHASLLASTLSEMQEAVRKFSALKPQAVESEVRLLSSFGGPLVDQMRPFFNGGALHVASPYFGNTVGGIKLLRDNLDVGPIRVFPALHGDSLDVPVKEISRVRDISAHRLSLSKKHQRFAHLKAYGCETPGGCWLFTTSANCTQQALAGNNVEAGLMRRVDKSVLTALFAEDATGKLPNKVRDFETPAGDAWLAMTATDRDSHIDVVVALPDSSLPLTEVTISVEYAGQCKRRTFRELFTKGSHERIPWSGFPKIHDRSHGTALLRLEAIVQGKKTRGAAFIDQPALLTSDPIHRSAWRATLAILDSEGLPDASDLACVFHLFEGLFRFGETAGETDETDENEPGVAHRQERTESEVEDKIPLWPPTSLEFAPPLIHSGRAQTIQWFQKILSELISTDRSVPIAQHASSSDDEPDEVMESAESHITPQIRKAMSSAWTFASDAFNRLVNRLQTIRLNSQNATKIWPISVGIFLITLGARKQILRNDPTAVVPAATELTNRFLNALFGDRCLDEDDVGPTAESVATELHTEFGIAPSADIAGIVRLLFATQFREGQLPEGWLRFREIIAEMGVAEAPTPENEKLYLRFLIDESRSAPWAEVASAWDKLSQMTWQQHPGYQQLNEILAWAENGAKELPSHLPESCRQLRSRIRSGRPWQYVVSRLKRCCIADGCLRMHMHDPTKAELAQLKPVICTACGSLLIPDLLAQAKGQHRERPL